MTVDDSGDRGGSAGDEAADKTIDPCDERGCIEVD